MKHLNTILLSLVLLPVPALAQGAFSHVGVGVEAGTTGVGVNLSAPLVHRHLYLTLGVNFPNVSVNQDFGIDAYDVNDMIDDMNVKIDRLNARYPNETPVEHVSNLGDEINVDATFKLNMQSYKVMLEYYPWFKRTFHFTAGVFIGNEDFVSAKGKIDSHSWSTYQKAIDVNTQIKAREQKYGESGYHVENLETALSYNVDDQTFRVDSRKDGRLDAAITLSKVRPYLGIGFGRSVPDKHRVGFQFEMGAWYHGEPKLTSSNEVPYDPSVEQGVDLDEDLLDVAHSLTFYPQITFRLTGRLF